LTKNYNLLRWIIDTAKKLRKIPYAQWEVTVEQTVELEMGKK
tara:strand:+ start:45 stop:170 length:126 start_codon:yes stop_codon:yes gene_type:complete